MYITHTAVLARCCSFIHSFIQSLIQAVSTAPLQVHYYSEALSTHHGYCAGLSRRSATGNCERRTCPRALRGGLRASLTHDSPNERRPLCQCATHANHTLAYVYMHVDIPDENKAGLHGEYLPSFT